MKTLNQLTTFALVIFSSLFIQTDLNGQSINLHTKASKKNKLYVSPLNLINPFGASAQLTYGRQLNQRSEIQVSYGHKMKYWTPSLFIKDDEQFIYDLYRPVSEGGYRIGVEYQHLISVQQRGVIYLAAEGYYKHEKYSVIKPLFNFFGIDAPVEVIDVKGLNCKMGMKINLGKNFLLDVYSGIGVSYYGTYVDEYKFEERIVMEASETVNGWAVNIPFNVKLGYNF